jgi:hypothetical protein
MGSDIYFNKNHELARSTIRNFVDKEITPMWINGKPSSRLRFTIFSKTARSKIFGSIGGGASEVMCDVIARLEGF